MNILAGLAFLVAIVLFVIAAFNDSTRPRLSLLAAAFLAAGLLAFTGFRF